MILKATFSKPAKQCETVLGKPYQRVRIWKTAAGYDAEFFTKTQAFRRHFTEQEAEQFLQEHTGTTFKSVVEWTESQEITVLANKRGKITRLAKPIKTEDANPVSSSLNGTNLNSEEKSISGAAVHSLAAHIPLEPFGAHNRTKRYLLPEGIPVPFLVQLGIMSHDGNVYAKKYDKFKQINRFLEFVDDVLPEVTERATNGTGFTERRPLRIADFGCGKSYLTFAVYHYLVHVRHIPTDIVGLDLRPDVIATCSSVAKDCGYEHLHFFVGNIADAPDGQSDIIITLHACDTASDYAIYHAIKCNAIALLCVPCCQHELNTQLQAHKTRAVPENPFAPLLRFGIVRERFAALATDVLRAEYLEQQGYNVQILEFIDMSHTSKNLLIRAVKKMPAHGATTGESCAQSLTRATALLDSLNVSQTLHELLQGPRTNLHL